MASFEKSTYSDYDKWKENKRKGRKEYNKKIREYMKSLLTECLFCGSTNDLVFHHVHASEKDRSVTRHLTKGRINEEASKCWCLCDSCHKKLHQRMCDPLPSTYASRISVP